jgi:alanine racemase
MRDKNFVLDGTIAWAEIDLDAIAWNVQSIRQFIGEGIELFAVVKANAYGHGSIPVSQAALLAGASRVAVHRLVEALELRDGGIQAPILLMGYTPPDGASVVVDKSLTPSVISTEFAEALSRRAQAKGVSVPVHIKVDTGMSRYGVMPSEVVAFARQLKRLPGILLEGIFTHFATADWLDQRYTLQQLDVFNQVLSELKAAGIQIPLVHVANSAGLAARRESYFSAVRPGLLLYGLPPSSEWPAPFELKPTLTVKSRVSRVADLPAGSAVSYGRTYIAAQPTRAALIPVGYGDGYPRALSNRASVLIHGQRAPIIGRVCMDQFVVDIAGIENVRQDDEVVLIGRQGDETISVQELADMEGTIQHEIIARLSARLVRVYLRGGNVVSVKSFTNDEAFEK